VKWLYWLATFFAAFLIFLVEPLAAKRLLPGFGGSAAVWIAALLFFQLALLGGYLWAHLLSRLALRRQAMAHSLLLLASVFAALAAPAATPVLPSLTPSLQVLATLAKMIGLPYLALAATGPLLQSWWSRTRSEAPWPLYALSNAGSFLGLIAYPLLVEPRLGLSAQSQAWTAALIACAALCSSIAWRLPSLPRPAPEEAAFSVWWVALPFCASLMLGAVTSDLTETVAPVPLLWVIPLGAYLLSFVVTFQSERIYRRAVWIPLLAVALAWLSHRFSASLKGGHIVLAVSAETAAFFVCAVVCHGELVRRKPSPRQLTGFYLAIAAGGALGGAFVAVLAPLAFRTELEFPLGLLLCAVLAGAALWRSRLAVRAAIALGVCALAIKLGMHERKVRAARILWARSFYSALSVEDDDAPDDTAWRVLIHGSIIHGAQWSDAARASVPTTYYATKSGAGRAVSALRELRPSLRVGVVGLGAGVMAAYCRPGDEFTFFEIDPLVERIARSQFSFLPACAGARVKLGDARLSLDADPARFDLLVVDAFSGDAIPTHLLTREALRLFDSRVARDGIVAVHISNRFADLRPVVAAANEGSGRRALLLEEKEGAEPGAYASDWVLLLGASPKIDAPVLEAPSGFRGWTDDYTDLAAVLHQGGASADDEDDDDE
jgi:hypothetical protein